MKSLKKQYREKYPYSKVETAAPEEKPEENPLENPSKNPSENLSDNLNTIKMSPENYQTSKQKPSKAQIEAEEDYNTEKHNFELDCDDYVESRILGFPEEYINIIYHKVHISFEATLNAKEEYEKIKFEENAQWEKQVDKK